jgi:hypothetical protein
LLKILLFSTLSRERDDFDGGRKEKRRKEKRRKKKVGIDRRSPTRDVQSIERSPLYSFSFSRPQTYALFFFRERKQEEGQSLVGKRAFWIRRNADDERICCYRAQS